MDDKYIQSKKHRTENREKLAHFKRMKNKQIDGKDKREKCYTEKIKTNKIMKTKIVFSLGYT